MSDEIPIMVPSAARLDTLSRKGQTEIGPQARGATNKLVPGFPSYTEELFTYLKVYRDSASFHLNEYLRFRQLVRNNSENGDGQLMSISKDTVPYDDGSALTQDFWCMKVERDSLVADLVTMEALLREIQSDSMTKPRWQLGASFLGIVVFATVGVTHGPVALAYMAIPGAISLLYPLVNLGVIRRCKSLATSIREMVERDKLESRNGRYLEGVQFKLLEWMNR